MLDMTDFLILQVTKAYQQKNYGRVYVLLLDFTKFYLYDLFLGSRKSFLINYHFTAEAEACRAVLARVLATLVVLWAPVLPLNSESAFQSLRGDQGMTSVFEAPWPKVSSHFDWKNKAQTDALKFLESIRQLKKIAMEFYAEEKGKVRDKQGIASQKKNVPVFDSEELIILLSSARKSTHSYYHQDLKALSACLSQFRNELNDIFECAEVNVLTERSYSPPGSLRTIQTEIELEGRTLPLQIIFVKLQGRKKCERCLKFAIKNTEDRTVCQDCHRFVHPRYFELEGGQTVHK